MPPAPTYNGAIAPSILAGNQQNQQGSITPEAAAINVKMQGLPSYQAYVQALTKGGTQYDRLQAAQKLIDDVQQLGGIPDNLTLDPFTAQVREKNWNERNKGWSALLYTGAAVGIGLTAGAAAGALGGAGAVAGATGGAAETAGAVGPLAGGYAGATTAAAVPASLAPAAAGVAGATTGGTLGAINGYVGSPLGQAVIGGVGNYFASKGASENNEANRQQTGAINAANQLSNQSTQDRQNAAAAATPLGESQNFVARNSLLNAILPNLKNINSGVGKRPGAGSFLPDGGLGTGNVDALYGATPTLESLSTRSKQLSGINPQQPKENLGSFGGFTPEQTGPFQAANDSYQAEVQRKQDAQRKALQEFINQGITGNGPLQSAIIGTGKTASY